MYINSRQSVVLQEQNYWACSPHMTGCDNILAPPHNTFHNLFLVYGDLITDHINGY